MKTITALLCLALLAACGSPPPAPVAAPAAAASAPAVDPNVLAPNANLVVQGIPPIPKSLVEEVGRYTDFRGHSFVDWHPTKREMIVSHRKAGASTPQLFRLTGPMAEPEPLTDSADPVTTAHYEPKDGRYIVFERASGGDEADQLHRLDLDTRAVTVLTDPKQRHDFGAWLHRTSRMLYMSVPLDRAGGKQENPVQTITLMDPAAPGRRAQACGPAGHRLVRRRRRVGRQARGADALRLGHRLAALAHRPGQRQDHAVAAPARPGRQGELPHRRLQGATARACGS